MDKNTHTHIHNTVIWKDLADSEYYKDSCIVLYCTVLHILSGYSRSLLWW